MKRTLFIALTILCCTLSAANSRDISFEHIDISNGLSQNTVQAIIQDREGFMWFGTKDGLNRFDGRHFKVFRHILIRRMGWETIRYAVSRKTGTETS